MNFAQRVMFSSCCRLLRGNYDTLFSFSLQADVVPVFGAMFAERALPPRMRAFAVQV